MALEHLKRALETIPEEPGVYRMTSAQGKDLYIGKAKNLLKRVSSYCQIGRLPHRLRQMVHHVEQVHVLVTKNELDALLLEANLIKRYQPPYNILLKGGHRFSYLVLSDHEFPQLLNQRKPGEKIKEFSCGPFLSLAPLQAIADVMHRAFLLRSCSDFTFAHRSRPCLQYHIQRCSAPCVKKISPEAYGQDVAKAIDLMQGKTRQVRLDLSQRMKQLSLQHAYDQARLVRDQLRALDQLEGSRLHTTFKHGDVVVLTYGQGVTCIQVVSFRHGNTFGSETFFFPKTTCRDGEEILSSFFMSFYETNPIPRRVLTNLVPKDAEDIKLMMGYRFQHVPHILLPKKGSAYQVVQQALSQAEVSLQRHLSSHQTHVDVWKQAAQLLKLKEIPGRIEVYDNSHHQGVHGVGIMVVADVQGFLKKEYRTFSMDLGGDDYAMMRQVMERRFRQSWPHPDLLVIDGGKGQRNAVSEVLRALNIHIPVISIVKRPPSDCILGTDGQELEIDDTSAVLHLMQRLRDEAHRFAVTTHRKLKRKALLSGGLKSLSHIGPKRYKILLDHFETPEKIYKARLEALLPLFSPRVAEKIYNTLQEASKGGLK